MCSDRAVWTYPLVDFVNLSHCDCELLGIVALIVNWIFLKIETAQLEHIG